MNLGIVTISFNQAPYLPEAIDSVRLRDPACLNYVVVDPGSTDGSREIIEANRERFSDMVLEKDRGPADGLNKGFARCGGDILGYLNSDDAFLPGALDWVLHYFEANPRVDILFGSIAVVGPDGRITRNRRTPDRINLSRYVHYSCFVWQQATFFRRALFERTAGFNIENNINWDAELVVDMLLRGGRAAYTDVLLGKFRMHPESITVSQRLVDATAHNCARMQNKIAAHGFEVFSPRREQFERFRYRWNPLRKLHHWVAPRVPRF